MLPFDKILINTFYNVAGFVMGCVDGKYNFNHMKLFSFKSPGAENLRCVLGFKT